MDAVNPSRSPFLAVLVGLALLAVAACQQITPAQIQGILQSVDSISGEVTVKLKDGGTITVNLQDVGVETLLQGVGSASLEPGSPVTIERDQSNKVKKLKAHAAEVEGVITGLDQTTKAVTILTEDNEEVTLQVTEATKIEMDEEEATFAALLVGQEVEAKYDLETTKALKIEIEEEEAEADRVEGAITAINTDAKTVTIQAENGTSATYTVTPETKLDLDGVGTFADLKTGMKVEARFNPATKALTQLKVEEKG